MMVAQGFYTSSFYARKQNYYGNSASQSYYYYWTNPALGTNYWQYASALQTYSQIGVFLVAFLTQVLAMAGVAPSLNDFVWGNGVFTYLMAVNVIYLVIMGYAFDIVNEKTRSAPADTDAPIAKS